LSIWEELKTIYTLYPDVSPEDLLKLATLNGAKILGFNKMGAILPGYIPNFLVINVKEYLNDNAEDTLKTLINSEKEVTYRVYA
jgi:cytosine/adenosine deaminase-related metal-dependent hydrolase